MSRMIDDNENEDDDDDKGKNDFDGEEEDDDLGMHITHITVVPHTTASPKDNFVQLSFDNFLLFQ